MEPAPAVRKRGFLPTGISAATLFVDGSTLVRTLCSVEVTHTNPLAKSGQNEPEGILMEATTVLVRGSMRERIPEVFVASHTLPAPTAMPPSELAGAAPMVF